MIYRINQEEFDNFLYENDMAMDWRYFCNVLGYSSVPPIIQNVLYTNIIYSSDEVNDLFTFIIIDVNIPPQYYKFEIPLSWPSSAQWQYAKINEDYYKFLIEE